ncbi:ABC transporter substrate-binding protein [Nonomuraea sp. NPDC050536]|uniref:ABC transporter substrate-binding protein n=1 Tax=Nonomuraea sp. NPDC050536 TaxID=3364366 RepID=UPI0037CBBAB2
MQLQPLPRTSAAIALIATLAAAGCSAAGGNASQAQGALVDGGTVKIGNNSEITSFHPYSQFGVSQAGYAYDPLVNVAADGKVTSGLAASWTATATDATFTLRKEVTCADGAKLTASDVVRSLEYAKDPKNKLVGAQTILPAGVPFTLRADDASGTVSVHLKSPYSFITRSIGTLPIICPAGLKDPASLERGSAGTGPYVLSGYQPGGPYTFTLRKGYAWGPGGATTDVPGIPGKIVISVVANESTRANLLLTGGLNVAGVSGPDVDRLRGSRLFTLDMPTVLGLTFFNERPGRPLSDLAVRRALITALDRGQLANVAAGGKGRPAQAISATNTVCHADLATANLPGGEDPTGALKAAGWTPGPGGTLAKDGKPLKIRLLTSPALGSTLPSVAELMAKTWKALGVDVQLASVDLNALVNDMYKTGDFDVVMGSSPGVPFPAQLIPYFRGPEPPTGLNFAGSRNADYAELVGKALREADESSCALWNQAEAALFRDADALPIADGIIPFFGNKVTFGYTFSGGIAPTSLRMHA